MIIDDKLRYARCSGRSSVGYGVAATVYRKRFRSSKAHRLLEHQCSEIGDTTKYVAVPMISASPTFHAKCIDQIEVT
jgi:hypothetical protein